MKAQSTAANSSKLMASYAQSKISGHSHHTLKVKGPELMSKLSFISVIFITSFFLGFLFYDALPNTEPMAWLDAVRPSA